MLDAAEHGEPIAISRAGRRLVLTGPAPTGNGAAVNDMLAAHGPDHSQRLTDTITVHLGPDHPDTLITRSNLAHWRQRNDEGTGTPG